jgi:hypothetical protein
LFRKLFAVMMVPVARSTVAAGKTAIRPDRHCPPAETGASRNGSRSGRCAHS